MRIRRPVATRRSLWLVLAAAGWLLSTLSALLLGATASAQETSEESEEDKAVRTGEVPYVAPLVEQQRVDIADALDTARTLRHIERLSSYHRLAPSPGLDQAMRYIERELKAAGLQDVETITYECDGKTTWWIEPAPPAWTCDKAELSIEEPDRIQIADWNTEPVRVAAFSTSCDVTADVVEVTDWNDQKLDVKGKIVLTSDEPLVAHAKAVQAGALGLLLAPRSDPEDGKLRKAAQASSLSPDLKDWESNRFAFNVSSMEADIIRTALAGGKRVRVKAVIENARTWPATAPIVTGRIRPTRPAKETILLLAEVAGPKPGANGVSGAAALLSLARSYADLLGNRALMEPTRNIEFLFVPDVHGARAYVEKRRADLGNVRAVIHLGVVGTNTEDGPFKDRPLNIADGGWLLPACVPYIALSFGRYCAASDLVDVAGGNAPLYMRMHVRGPVNAHTVFYGGDLGIQTVSISYLPDDATNTSIDTVDMLDPTALKRTSYMALGTAYVLATPAQGEIQRLAPLMGPYSMHDLHGAFSVFGILLSQASKEEIADFYTYIDAVLSRNQTRNNTTSSESLEVLLPSEQKDQAKRFGSSAGSTYSDRANEVLGLYEARREREGLADDKVVAFRKGTVQLLAEIPSMRWRGPVTPELLKRRAPSALPVPDAVDVTALFALVDGKRGLYDVWAEHEAMKWIGVPFPLPRPEQLQLPPRADLNATIEFLRRCDQAGVITIRAKEKPNEKSAPGGTP